VTGAWHHLAVVPPAHRVFHARTKKHGASQEMALRRENFRLLNEGLAEYRDVIGDAVAIVSTGALYRDEKIKGVATWLQTLAAATGATRGRNKSNLVWLAVATSPSGFSHLSTTVFGSLLQDLKSGVGVEDARRKFNAKMHPLQYQRPQAAPTEGNIAQAEALFKELGLEPALHRRFARFEELRGFVWQEPVQEQADTSVFGHLKPKAAPERQSLACGKWTWTRFAAEILPTVSRMHMVVPGGRAAFAALVTASTQGLHRCSSGTRRNIVTRCRGTSGMVVRRRHSGISRQGRMCVFGRS
jgi:hypothetical protein